MKYILTIAFLLTGLIAEEKHLFQREMDDAFYTANARDLFYGEPEEVVHAAERLAFAKTSRANRDLIKALDGNNKIPNSQENRYVVKFYSAKALGVIGHEVSVNAVIKEYNEYIGKVEEKVKKKRSFKDEVATSASLHDPNFFHLDDITITMMLGEFLRVLGELPSTPESKELLKSALKHKNYYIRSSAADAFRIAKNKENIPVLIEALGEEKEEYTKAAILASIVNLKRVADPHFHQLVDLLKSEDYTVRFKVSVALGEAHIRIAETKLRQAMDIENDLRVRSQMRKDLASVIGHRLPPEPE